MTTARAPVFPPLLTGVAVPGDPFAAAREAVATDVEPGTVYYGVAPDLFETALVLAPDVPLARAIGVSFCVTLGLNDALGALAPPEMAVHLVWPDRIRVNGALCGRLRAAAATADPQAEPDWLILALEVPLQPRGDVEPGLTPDETCLAEEGCPGITAGELTETWARHMMNWLHIFMTEGFEPLHRDWLAKGFGYKSEIDYPEPGTFLGLDETGGMILKTPEGTKTLSLLRLLEP